jgi:hypothetical protein
MTVGSHIARVVLNGRSTAITCTATKVTENGAKLAFSMYTVVPDEFELQIPRLKQLVQARVIWRKGPAIGVRFITGPKSPEAA